MYRIVQILTVNLFYSQTYSFGNKYQPLLPANHIKSLYTSHKQNAHLHILVRKLPLSYQLNIKILKMIGKKKDSNSCLEKIKVLFIKTLFKQIHQNERQK